MAEQLEILSAEAHRNLAMHRFAGQHPHMVQIVLPEVEAAASCCPVFLAKSPETGRFALVALFGFAPGEVLVEGADTGSAAFLPLDLQRQGFFTSDDNIAVDIAHPRFAQGASIALFDETGSPTIAMRAVQRAIGTLMGSAGQTEQFIAALVQGKLVEPVDISLSFDDGQTVRLDGLYSVSGEALSAIDDNEMIRLFRNGSLQAAFAIRASLRQVGILARRRNDRITQPSLQSWA
ncbi:SapC family protein [Novosphingobium taihuense]|uniref:SapC protein n=1 Tax=Novosphingobium taihuense TaxID=260085 RepID=A0A7W7ADI9_9SPHN|nr:SapC family protein [Novosphingobium taihuense]MBB4614916.1 hypothetical protein [Novosphingobium taihuense]TWH84643.1 SapC protein [Novosphingobium taihuense]